MRNYYHLLSSILFLLISCADNESESLSFLEKYAEDSQIFELDLDKPDTIIGAKGTVLYINPQDFELVSNEALRIELREFHTKEDLFFNDAPTVSNGRLLESGGAYSIRAFQENEDVDLKSGKTIGARFPVLTGKKMSLFTGNRDVDGRLNWEPTGQDLYLEQYRSFYIKDTVVLNPYNTEMYKVDTYMINYFIDSLGVLSQAASREKVVSKKYQVDSTLLFNDTLVYYPFTKIYFESYEGQPEDAIKYEINKMNLYEARSALNGTNDALQNKSKEEHKKWRLLVDSKATFENTLYEEVRLSNLGFINVDCFVPETASTVQLTLSFENESYNKYVYVLYQNRNTLIRLWPDINDGTSYKIQLPLDGAFTILAVDFDTKGNLLGTQKVLRPTKNSKIELRLLKISKNQMTDWLRAS